jgi:hypothetical protein
MIGIRSMVDLHTQVAESPRHPDQSLTLTLHAALLPGHLLPAVILFLFGAYYMAMEGFQLYKLGASAYFDR